MNDKLLSEQMNFKRGTTNLYFKVIFMGEEIGEVKALMVEGHRKWSMEGCIGDSRVEAVEKYLFDSVASNEKEPIPDPTFSEYDPTGLIFPSGDEVVGFWFIEDGVKYHLALDSEGREYETSEKPIAKISP